MLNVFATITSPARQNASHVGKRLRITDAKPTPLTMPMRAHMPWMTAIIGVVIEREPQHREAGRRACDGVRRDAGRVIVGGAGDDARPEIPQEVDDPVSWRLAPWFSSAGLGAGAHGWQRTLLAVGATARAIRGAASSV